MKRRRFSEEQVVQILKELEGAKSVEEICREYNIARSTLYLWRKKYGGLDKPLLRKLKQLEKENARLKKIVAQQVLDLDSLKDLLGKDL